MRFVLLLCTVTFTVANLPARAATPLVEHGRYVFRLAGCGTCHTDGKHGGKPLAGGRSFKTPFGTFYSPNITPDRVYGIGNWSERDLRRALHDGVTPAGRHLAPVFPYAAYTFMRDQDVHALYAYLRTVQPVDKPDRAQRVPWYLRSDLAYHGWQMLFLSHGPFAGNPARSARWNRGAYIATALGHCAECHTPRNAFGGLDLSRSFAGTPHGPEGGKVPPLRHGGKRGPGDWSRSDLENYFQMGMTPDGDFAGGLMAEVINNGLQYLTDGDRAALADFVHSLRAAR